MLFNVFGREGQTFDGVEDPLKTKQGFMPYVKKIGIGRWRPKRYLVDELSDKAAKLNTGSSLAATRTSSQIAEKIDTEIGTFQDAAMMDIRADYAAEKLQESYDYREEASKELSKVGGGMRPRNTSEAMASYNRRVQGFKAAKRALKKSAEAGDQQGSHIKYNTTGYEAMDPNIDTYYAMFDQQIEERRQFYIDQFAGEGMTYNDLTNTGYSGGAGGDPDGVGLGQRDIDALVLGDILGMSLYDIAFIDTLPGDEWGVLNAINDIREATAQGYVEAGQNVFELSEMENENRKKLADKIKLETRNTQLLSDQQRQESIAVQKREISEAEKAAQAQLDTQLSMLTDLGSGGKKRVQGVDFKEARPQ